MGKSLILTATYRKQEKENNTDKSLDRLVEETSKFLVDTTITLGYTITKLMVDGIPIRTGTWSNNSNIYRPVISYQEYIRLVE